MDKKELKETYGENKTSMENKVHFEISFTETEDGYILEANGDKDALRRLGIGPRMLEAKRGRRRHHKSHKSGIRGQRREARAWRRAQFAEQGPGSPRGSHIWRREAHERQRARFAEQAPRGPRSRWREAREWRRAEFAEHGPRDPQGPHGRHGRKRPGRSSWDDVMM